LAEVTLQDGETVENALRRFKRKVLQEDIIRESQKARLLLEAGPETPRQAGVGP
jgi:small subunit ribosomal protein S21